jgi:hypothetical protein
LSCSLFVSKLYFSEKNDFEKSSSNTSPTQQLLCWREDHNFLKQLFVGNSNNMWHFYNLMRNEKIWTNLNLCSICCTNHVLQYVLLVDNQINCNLLDCNFYSFW